ncbi:MAG: DMT family transporter [Bacteroidia bacterium]
MSSKNRLWSWIIIISLTLIWGSTFIILKKALTVYSPEQVFAGRMMVAALALAYWSVPALKRIERRYWLPLVGFALISNFIVTLLYATAQTRIESAVNGMLNTLTPLMTLLVGVIVYNQKMRIPQGVGLLVGLVGTLFLVFNTQSNIESAINGILNTLPSLILLLAGVVFYKRNTRIFQVFGTLLGLAGFIILIIQTRAGTLGIINWFASLTVLATFCNGLTANMFKFNLAGLPAVSIVAVSFLIVFPIAIFEAFRTDMFVQMANHDPGFTATGYLILLGLLGNALGLFLIGKLIQLSSPVFASMTTYLVPLLALLWGFLDGEQIGLYQIGAMGLILISVFIVDRFDKPSQPETA